MNTNSQLLHRFGATVLRVLLVVLLALLGVMIAAVVSAQTVPEATETLEAAEASVAAETERFDALRGEYEGELATVNALRSSGVLNAFNQTGLRDALRRANSSADALALADARRLSALSRRDAASATLARALQAEIDAVEADLLSLIDPGALSAAVQELNELSARQAELAQRAASERVDVPISEILADLPETAEEMLAAADELADHAARLEADLAYWSGEAARYETRRRIERISGEYRVQDDLFGDGTAGTQRAAQGATSEQTSDDDTNVVEAEAGGGQEPDVTANPPLESGSPTTDGGSREQGDFSSEDPFVGMGPEGNDSGNLGGEAPDPGNTPTVTFPGRVHDFGDAQGGGAVLVEAREGSDPTVRAIDTITPNTLEQDSGRAISDPRQRRDAVAAELQAVRAEQERLLRSASALQE